MKRKKAKFGDPVSIADLASATTATIKELRKAFKIMKGKKSEK